MMRIAGVDESGRGPVLGPMVMAIVACEEDEESKLKREGVKDSKLVSKEKRETLAVHIEETYPFEVIMITPQEIDESVDGDGDNLNKLEARTTALLINQLSQQVKLDKVIVDSPQTSTGKYERMIRQELKKMNGDTDEIDIVAETKADYTYPVVGAASILAKVARDAAIREIEEVHGPIGTGYLTDPRTQEFLHGTWHEGHDFFRKSWESFKRLARMANQSSLEEFYEEKRRKHGKDIAAFEQLKEHGFGFLEPTNPYEVVRMRKDRVTVIRYTTGKTVVQGPKEEKEGAKDLLKRLNLA